VSRLDYKFPVLFQEMRQAADLVLPLNHPIQFRNRYAGFLSKLLGLQFIVNQGVKPARVMP
jgi:hypothetical protein